MKSQLKSDIIKGIERAIEKHSEGQVWEYYIHDKLPQQMADAAEAVFDACQDGQKFAEENDD